MRFRRLVLRIVGLLLLFSPAEAATVAGHGGPIRALAIAPDGRTALTGGFDYSVILWDLESGRPLRRMIGHDAAVDAVAFLPGGRAVSAGDDRTLIVWNLRNGAIEARWTEHAAKVAALAVAPGGESVASAGWDRRVVLWDVPTGEKRVLGEAGAAVNAVAFSPDGTLLASGDYDGHITLWRIPEGAAIATLRGNGFPVNALAFSGPGTLLAALGDGSVRVLDPTARRETRRSTGLEDPAVSLAVAPDGALAATGSSRGSLALWRIASGDTIRTLNAAPGPVWAVAFAPDGKRLLAGGSDGVLRAWSVATGAELWGGQPGIAAAIESADRGAMLFRKCAACHDFDPNDRAKAGPTFWHLFGRHAGAAPGYPYSPALKSSPLVWDAATIDRLFAQGPQAVAPGSKMPLQKMPSAADRAALIGYLKQHAGGDKPAE
jgi:cytochrome c